MAPTFPQNVPGVFLANLELTLISGSSMACSVSCRRCFVLQDGFQLHTLLPTFLKYPETSPHFYCWRRFFPCAFVSASMRVLPDESQSMTFTQHFAAPGQRTRGTNSASCMPDKLTSRTTSGFHTEKCCVCANLLSENGVPETKLLVRVCPSTRA